MATVNVEQTEQGVVLKIDGRFDFNLHGEFRDAYETALREREPTKFIIDMGGTDYMDSSALGISLNSSLTSLRLHRAAVDLR